MELNCKLLLHHRRLKVPEVKWVQANHYKFHNFYILHTLSTTCNPMWSISQTLFDISEILVLSMHLWGGGALQRNTCILITVLISPSQTLTQVGKVCFVRLEVNIDLQNDIILCRPQHCVHNACSTIPVRLCQSSAQGLNIPLVSCHKLSLSLQTEKFVCLSRVICQ